MDKKELIEEIFKVGGEETIPGGFTRLELSNLRADQLVRIKATIRSVPKGQCDLALIEWVRKKYYAPEHVDLPAHSKTKPNLDEIERRIKRRN